MNTELKNSLLQMVEEARLKNELASDGSLYEGYPKPIRELHLKQANELEKIVETSGWPEISLVGKEGADADWLILQHAIGPFASNLLVSPSDFQWLRGDKHAGRYEIEDARHSATSFCTNCGSSLPWLAQRVERRLWFPRLRSTKIRGFAHFRTSSARRALFDMSSRDRYLTMMSFHKNSDKATTGGTSCHQGPGGLFRSSPR